MAGTSSAAIVTERKNSARWFTAAAVQGHECATITT